MLNSHVNLGDITGSNFCYKCMVGGDSASHRCEEAQDVLDSVEENCYNQEICYVLSNEINENYFEYKANTHLKEQNKSLKEDYHNLNLELDKARKYLFDLNCEIKGVQQGIEELKTISKNRWEQINDLENHLSGGEEKNYKTC